MDASNSNPGQHEQTTLLPRRLHCCEQPLLLTAHDKLLLIAKRGRIIMKTIWRYKKISCFASYGAQGLVLTWAQEGKKRERSKKTCKKHTKNKQTNIFISDLRHSSSSEASPQSFCLLQTMSPLIHLWFWHLNWFLLHLGTVGLWHRLSASSSFWPQSFIPSHTFHFGMQWKLLHLNWVFGEHLWYSAVRE